MHAAHKGVWGERGGLQHRVLGWFCLLKAVLSCGGVLPCSFGYERFHGRQDFRVQDIAAAMELPDPAALVPSCQLHNMVCLEYD